MINHLYWYLLFFFSY